MEFYAVIDTNVLLSALLSKSEDSATVKVLDAVFDGKIIPLYHQDIFSRNTPSQIFLSMINFLKLLECPQILISWGFVDF